VPIIVATIAFGMGIDKPDIRLIVHYHLPKTLEGYYQETGRAGRDGLASQCVLFYSYGDKMKQDYFINQIEDFEEQARAKEKLEQVIDFCELLSCRRQYLLEYFGETWPKPSCDSCDVCLRDKQEFDATEVTKKIIQAIIKSGERFGVSHIIKILRGSQIIRIKELGHDQLDVYDSVAEFSELELKSIIKSLMAKNILQKNPGEYPTLSVTEQGRQFLHTDANIMLAKPVTQENIRQSKTADVLDYDQELFEKLRLLRRKIAQDNNVPPFVIFGDVTLHEMAYYLPQSSEGLSRIFGVGKEKLARFGDTFLKVIIEHTIENNLAERQIPIGPGRQRQRTIRRAGSTYDETKQLVNERLSIAQIAQQRHLAESTVVSHRTRSL
jgi:ATP-dependent DNA helicase RecQ